MYTGQAKFTQAPPVVPVTNIRYGPRVSTLVYFDAHRKNDPHGNPQCITNWRRAKMSSQNDFISIRIFQAPFSTLWDFEDRRHWGLRLSGPDFEDRQL